VYYEHFIGIERARSYADLRRLVAHRDDIPRATTDDALRALAARYVASREGGWLSGGRGSADERVTANALIDEAEGAFSSRRDGPTAQGKTLIPRTERAPADGSGF
jgi:hypothetical protein